MAKIVLQYSSQVEKKRPVFSCRELKDVYRLPNVIEYLEIVVGQFKLFCFRNLRPREKQKAAKSKNCFSLNDGVISFLNGPIRASFCLFSYFLHDKNQILIVLSGDGSLGTQTRGSKIEGAHETTELWGHAVISWVGKVMLKIGNPLSWLWQQVQLFTTK